MTAQEIGLLLIDAAIAVFLACLSIVCAIFVVTYFLEKYIDVRERIEISRRGAVMIDSKNRSTCEGCAHFEWEQDMGASYPRCSLKGEYKPKRCDEFTPSKLYRMYLEMVGKGGQR